MDEDLSSIYISGNLDCKPRNVHDSDEEDDDDDDYDLFEDCTEDLDDEPLTIDEFMKAEDLLVGTYGFKNSLSTFVKLLLTQRLSTSDLAVQSIVYKIQAMKKGSKSLRYLPSWGMYWAAIRNLVKSRGLVAFSEHFCIPTRLSKFKDKILDLCGLSKIMLGKPGLQKENVQMFVSAKQSELKGKTLCVSVAIDAKKIAVTPGKEGREDMGGLTNMETPIEVDEKHDSEKQTVISMLRASERKDLFSLYDILSKVGGNIVQSSAALDLLVESNSKKLDKNPRLAKYIYILNQKLMQSQHLLKSLDFIQSEVIKLIATKRNCLNLTPLPLKGKHSTCLADQSNYIQLTGLSEEEEAHNIKVIEDFKRMSKSVGDISWTDLEKSLTKPLHQTPSRSETSEAVLSISSLRSDQAFKAAGLSKIRPLQDMKDFYVQYQTKCSASMENMKNLSIIATFCSHFAPMSFGSNLSVRQAGLYVGSRVLAVPDMVVIDKENNVVYCVVSIEVQRSTLKVDDEMISNAIMTAHSCNASKGCLLLLHSDISLVVFSVPKSADISQKFLDIISSYSTASKCLSKRSKVMNERICSLKEEVRKVLENIVTLGCYPIVEAAETSVSVGSDESDRSVDNKNLENKIVQFLDESHRFETKSAKEVIAVNIQDMVGQISIYPHTALAGVFLSSGSLKVVAKDVLRETTEMLKGMEVAVLNYGVDGESLGLATTLPNGAPGTTFSLAKYLLKKLQLFSKSDLIRLCSENKNINISGDVEVPGEMVDELDTEVTDEMLDSIEIFVENTVEAIKLKTDEDADLFTLEDLETWLSCKGGVCKEREVICKEMKKEQLKFACLKLIFPIAKKAWLIKFGGSEGFRISLKSSEIFYIPNTVFHQSESGIFRTVTFDTAHICNLLREHAAKNRLTSFGLHLQSLERLSKLNGFEYLKKILKLKNLQSLEFDPMNQKSSALLFSSKTEDGLKKLKDFEGASFCQLIRQGIIEGLDKSGISAEERIQNIFNLKTFLDKNVDILEKVKKVEKTNITNELYQMINISLDSHITTYANLEMFNPRRKGTGSVEQFFSQLTLMCEGGTKLNCREISDILSRIMITNALRLIPVSLKGFSFLANLGQHMTSYRNEKYEDENPDGYILNYPELHRYLGLEIHPQNSVFDMEQRKYKRKQIMEPRILTGESDGSVRKFWKKF